MKILGIDPGVHGGLAIVAINDGVAPVLVDAIDVPTVGPGVKERVNVPAVRNWIDMHRPQHALIERGGSMPKQGVASTFKFARAVGALEAIIACTETPYSIIEPSSWKRHHGLIGRDKEASRQRVLELFPNNHELFALKRHHQRAEAVLIALTPVPGTVPKVILSSPPIPVRSWLEEGAA